MIPLDRVRALREAATPGPWDAGAVNVYATAGCPRHCVGGCPTARVPCACVIVTASASDRDRLLIAAAPDLARDVLTLADALATADASIVQLRADLERADHERQRVESERDAMEEQRDTARSALDGLVAAVRAEREAERGHAAVRADDASRGRHLRAAEAAVDKARHATDAILSAAPPRSTVDARVVREVIAARAALIAVSSERRDVWTRVDHGQRENAASARLVAAEAALDAALAGCA